MKNPFILALGFFAILFTCLQAEKEGTHDLSGAEQAQLQRDKVIITGRTRRQIFSPYIFSDKPVFITTDSVLNAWHVLLENSIRTMEERFANDLPDALDKALESIPKKAPEGIGNDLFDSAARRARLVLGTASKLAGGRWSGGKELDDMIAVDAQRVEEARGIALPVWLAKDGLTIVGFDHAIFRPQGMYAGTERMKRYFRAVRWLQTVPFDLKRDDQLASMWLITAALENSKTVLKISEAFEQLLGKGDTIDACGLSHDHEASNTKTPSKWYEGVIAKFSPKEFDKTLSSHPAVVLSARALADVDLFTKTTGRDRPLPSTLEAAALYGSPMAMDLLKNEKDVLLKIAEARTKLAQDETLQGKYFRCLSGLYAKPEPDVPAFMSSVPWQRKSLNTGLAGWAQLRHAFTLQGKENGGWGCGGHSDPQGFVEPNPEFFHHLGSLASSSQKILRSYDVMELSPADFSRKASDLLPLFQDLVDPVRKRRMALKEGKKLSEEEEKDYQDMVLKACDQSILFQDIFIDVSMGMMDLDPRLISDDPEFDCGESFLKSLLTKLKKMVDGENLREVMAEYKEHLNKYQPQDRWEAFTEICHELETLAHKQLRGLEHTKDEVRFITSYGMQLSHLMFHDGSSGIHPRDDAPRVSSVFNQPGHGFLLAGVGRPREIWVLYPWKGREIACRGAVMPFLEMPSDKHLTDKDWKDVLDGSSCPTNPEWLKPVITGDKK